jgi:hypothetical protein
MKELNFKNGYIKRLKIKVCLLISKFILSIYSNFRNCSGLQQEANKKLEEYKKGVNDVKIVKRELPKVKKGIDELHYINSVLKGRLDYALDDIRNIDSMYRSDNIKDIGTVLSKYDFSIKIDI